jgi:hypothetical protein
MTLVVKSLIFHLPRFPSGRCIWDALVGQAQWRIEQSQDRKERKQQSQDDEHEPGATARAISWT